MSSAAPNKTTSEKILDKVAAGCGIGLFIYLKHLCEKDKTGEWTVCWWQPVSAETVAAENKAVEASRATDADVAVPVPDGP